MYDKFGLILRIETFTNDVSFFKHHRRVEHRDGTYSYKTANMRKTIYSLPDLAQLLCACNRRYLDFHLTTLGRQVVTTSLKLKELFIIPNLRGKMRFA